MPNYVSNNLTVSGSPKDLKKFQERVRGYGPRYKGGYGENEPAPLTDLSFHSLVPVPNKYQNMTYGGEAEGTNDSGYSWEYDNWGTKWGACDVEVDTGQIENGYIIYTFWTAWSPPYIWLKTVSQMFPMLTFSDEYGGEIEQPGQFTLRDGNFEGDA